MARLKCIEGLESHIATKSCRTVLCCDVLCCSASSLSGLDKLARLKWLCIEGLESHISTSSVPALGQLTKLTRLQLLNCKGFQPILLSGMLHLEVGNQWTVSGKAAAVSCKCRRLHQFLLSCMMGAHGNGSNSALRGGAQGHDVRLAIAVCRIQRQQRPATVNVVCWVEQGQPWQGA